MMDEIVNANWNYPTPIWFGLDRSSEIVKALLELSIKKPLLVTDPNFSKNENFLQIIQLLKGKKLNILYFQTLRAIRQVEMYLTVLSILYLIKMMELLLLVEGVP